MQRLLALVAVFFTACSSSATPAQRPQDESRAQPALDAGTEPPIDAAPDAGVPEAVSSAPAWVFRYATKDRTETWTLQFADRAALLVVDSASGAMRYTGSAAGSATEGAGVVLDVATATAKLKLDCKRAKRAVSAKCNDTKAKKRDVLDCYHPDFKEPMPFGPAPGIEYVVSDACTGYRAIAP